MVAELYGFFLGSGRQATMQYVEKGRGICEQESCGGAYCTYAARVPMNIGHLEVFASPIISRVCERVHCIDGAVYYARSAGRFSYSCDFLASTLLLF